MEFFLLQVPVPPDISLHPDAATTSWSATAYLAHALFAANLHIWRPFPYPPPGRHQSLSAYVLQGACVAAAALMQYFFMVAFCWMLVEGIYLYLFVVKVYNVSHKMTVYHVMSWGKDNQLNIVTHCDYRGMDFFTRACLFTNFRSCDVSLENWFLHILSYSCVYECIIFEKIKEQFSSERRMI